MKQKSPLGFEKGAEIRLDFGPVITPIYRYRQGEVNETGLAEYLMSVRKAKCKFTEDCIDALLAKSYCVGFSCESCPGNAAK